MVVLLDPLDLNTSRTLKYLEKIELPLLGGWDSQSSKQQHKCVLSICVVLLNSKWYPGCSKDESRYLLSFKTESQRKMLQQMNENKSDAKETLLQWNPCMMRVEVQSWVLLAHDSVESSLVKWVYQYMWRTKYSKLGPFQGFCYTGHSGTPVTFFPYLVRVQ